MKADNRLNMLGLAMRAGFVIDGEGRVLDSLKNADQPLLFLASDAGENITKKIKDKALHYQLSVIEDYDTDTLSKAIGKINRKVLAVTDQGFVKRLKG